MQETTTEVKRVRTIPPKIEALQELVKNPLRAFRLLHSRRCYEFLQYYWPLVSTHKFQQNWHIEYLCGELEKLAYQVGARQPREYDLIINVPPGSTKTITCSIMFPAWCWTKWPWMRFICSSYSGALSLESAEYCRELIRSAEFQQIYQAPCFVRIQS